MLTIMTDKHGNFLKAEARRVLRGSQDKQKAYQQTDTGGTEMEQRVLARLRKDSQVGSEDWNDALFHRTKKSLDDRCSITTLALIISVHFLSDN